MSLRVVIIANFPIWIIPCLEDRRHTGHYATWLESLIPEFEGVLAGSELHWVTFSKQVSEPLYREAYGQYFHILPRKRLSFSMITKYFFEKRAAKKVIEKIQPDLVHAWGAEEACGIIGLSSVVQKKLFTLQGSLTDYVQKMGGPLLFRLQASYEKGTVKAYQRATAESPMAADLLRALNSKLQIDLVEYGVNQDFHEAHWNPSATPTVMFVGGVDDRKGVRDLVTVAADPLCAHLTFKIAGDGPLRSELGGISSKNVLWLGKCSRSEVIKNLEDSWVLAIPTHADTGPTVVKEARVVGLPIITTHSAGAASYIRDSECGVIINHSQPTELMNAILLICENRGTALDYGGRGVVEHREKLKSVTTAKDFLRIYTEMIGDSQT